MIHYIIPSLVLLLILAAALGIINNRSVRNGLVWLANNAQIVNITPKGRATAVADAAFTQRYLIAKRGAYEYSIAMAGAGDIPYAVVPDMTPLVDQGTGDLSYPLPVNILGLNEDTERMIAAGAIAINDLLTTAATGTVQTLAGIAAGTYWVVGRAKIGTLNGAGDQVEVIPAFPFQVTIA